MNSKINPIIAILPFLIIGTYFSGIHFFAADEYSYMNSAYGFMTGITDEVDIDRFPLFPATLTIAYSIFGFSDTVSKLFVVLIGVFTIFLVYIMTKELFDEKTAFWASLILSTSPLFVFFGTRVLTEMLFMFLFVANVFVLHRASNNPRYFPLLGILFGMLLLTRYVGAFFIFIIIPYLYFQKRLTLIKTKWFFLGIVTLIISLSPYIWFNYSITGNPIGLILSFFSGQVGVTQGTMGWPDAIPSFFIVLPFILGTTSILLWHTVLQKRKALIKNNYLILSFVILITTIFLEIYYLIGTPLLRYIIIILPFLSILAAVKIDTKKIRYLAIILITINLIGSLYVTGTFFESYTKHRDYAFAGIYAQNCSSYFTNIRYSIFHFTKITPSDMDERPECIIISLYDSIESPVIPEGYNLIYTETISDMIQIHIIED